MKHVIAMVLAGGRGERLYPLTIHRAKPAVPFGGVYRIIDFTLSNCINSGLRKICVLTQYKSYSLNQHLETGWNYFNRNLGEFLEVIPPQQRMGEYWYRGTADAIYQNLNIIVEEGPREVLVLSGDHIYKMNYEEMIRYHRDSKADVTVGTIEVPVEMAARSFGVLGIDDGSRIDSFEEKPEHPKPVPGNPSMCLSNIGVYLFNTEFMLQRLHEDAQNKESVHDFGRNVIPAMIQQGARVFAFNFRDQNKKQAKYWRDVGDIDTFFEANLDLIQVDPLLNLYDMDWPIRTLQPQFPPAKFVFADPTTDRMGVAYDSIVTQGCIVSGGKVIRSVLSPNVRVNSFSRVDRCVLFEGVSIGRRARVQNAIIDKDVKVPEGMEIGFNPEEDKKRFFVSPGGIVVIPKRAELG